MSFLLCSASGVNAGTPERAIVFRDQWMLLTVRLALTLDVEAPVDVLSWMTARVACKDELAMRAKSKKSSLAVQKRSELIAVATSDERFCEVIRDRVEVETGQECRGKEELQEVLEACDLPERVAKDIANSRVVELTRAEIKRIAEAFNLVVDLLFCVLGRPSNEVLLHTLHEFVDDGVIPTSEDCEECEQMTEEIRSSDHTWPREQLMSLCWEALAHLICREDADRLASIGEDGLDGGDEDETARLCLSIAPGECAALAEAVLGIKLKDVEAFVAEVAGEASEHEQTAGASTWVSVLHRLGHDLATCSKDGGAQMEWRLDEY
jgi:hypothetical protein